MATGSIRIKKTKDGEIRYQITVEGERDTLTGKRNRTYKNVKGSKREANAVMHKMITEMDNGVTSKKTNIRVSEWMDQWISLYLPIVTIFIDLLIVNHDTNERYYFCETIPNYSGNPRSEEFFSFIKNNKLPFGEYHYLSGMVFDAKIVYDQSAQDIFPILCDRKIISPPFKK